MIVVRDGAWAKIPEHEWDAFKRRVIDMERALWIASRDMEIVVQDDTPRAIEWKETDDGGRLVRRAR